MVHLQARGIYDRADRARLVDIASEEQQAPSDTKRPDLEGSNLPGVETVWALNTPDTELVAKSAVHQVSARLLELAALLGAQQGSTRDSAGVFKLCSTTHRMDAGGLLLVATKQVEKGTQPRKCNQIKA